MARLDEGLASLAVRVSRFYAGAAHPGAVLLTFTYDLRTGRRLDLADLFTPGSPYLAKLSELSRQLLAAQPGFDELQDFVAPGTEPTAENFAGWTVTDQDLVDHLRRIPGGPVRDGEAPREHPLRVAPDPARPRRPPRHPQLSRHPGVETRQW